MMHRRSWTCIAESRPCARQALWTGGKRPYRWNPCPAPVRAVSRWRAHPDN